METTFEIHYPSERTYWVFWTNKTDNFVYGWTEPTQQTDTNQPNWWTTLDEDEWVAKLETEFTLLGEPIDITITPHEEL
jgi:hypothetical protein